MICYAVVNNVNSKYYIGRTKFSVDVRWRGHLDLASKGAQALFYRALRKYGAHSFSVVEIYVSLDNDWFQVGEVEKELIRSYNSLAPNGYNMAQGGQGGVVVWTEESRKRMSDKIKMSWQTTRRLTPSPLKGMKIPPEVLKSRQKAKPRSEAARAKISKASLLGWERRKSRSLDTGEPLVKDSTRDKHRQNNNLHKNRSRQKAEIRVRK
jgi:group I intron endonuclease